MFRYVEHKTQQLNMSETKQLCLPKWGTILHSVFSEAMWVSVKMEGLKTLCLSSYQRQIHPKIKPNSSKSHSAPENHPNPTPKNPSSNPPQNAIKSYQKSIETSRWRVCWAPLVPWLCAFHDDQWLGWKGSQEKLGELGWYY